MARVRVAEAAGAALDWMVAKALNPDAPAHGWDAIHGKAVWTPYSTMWGVGGPIIEREGIAIHPSPTWTARYGLAVLGVAGILGHFQQIGPTPLIAAMRCFVTSRLGIEVDVPDELV